MQINYFGVHAELCHNLLSVWGYDEETLRQNNIFAPLLTLSSTETRATLWRSVIGEQAVLHGVLVEGRDYGVKHLLYVLQEFCAACSDKKGCLYDGVSEDKLKQAWKHVKTHVIPSLGDDGCVITFGAVG